MSLKQRLEDNLIWFVLTMILAGVGVAFKIEGFSKDWAGEVIESNKYRTKVEEWANKEAIAVVNASDDKRIAGLVDKIAQNENYRIQIIHHLDTDPDFLKGFVQALKGDPQIVAMLKGAQGDKGPMGDKGPRGNKGPQGDQGLLGKKGPTGDKGPQGDKGPVGEKGATGDKGPQGDKGLTGDKGPQGEKGLPGEKGAQGEKGPQGEKGIQGDKGEKGDKGQSGN